MLLRQIEHFVSVVENNSFTKASEVCHISQSAISQSIKALEEELGTELLIRKNKKFEISEAGQYFYRKGLILLSEVKRIKAETRHIATKDDLKLSLAYLSTYLGSEFKQAVAAFKEAYPLVKVEVKSGDHEDLYYALTNNEIDLAFNDQRRVFSKFYENIVLKESYCYIDIAAYNHLAKLEYIDIDDLNKMFCILPFTEHRVEESEYYINTIGLHNEFIYAGTEDEAEFYLITNNAFKPVDGVDENSNYPAYIKRKLLCRNGERLTRTYCAFYSKEENYYRDEFVKILRSFF